MSNKLPKKQEKFCQEYVIDLNGTQAAIRAGYSENSANEQASRMLANVNIKERIKELQLELQERNKLKADDVINELRKIGFMDIGQLYDENGYMRSVNELSDNAKAAVSSVKITERSYGRDENTTIEKTTEMKLWDKGKALVELGRHLGVFEKDNGQKGSGIAQVIINRKAL